MKNKIISSLTIVALSLGLFLGVSGVVSSNNISNFNNTNVHAESNKQYSKNLMWLILHEDGEDQDRDPKSQAIIKSHEKYDNNDGSVGKTYTLQQGLKDLNKPDYDDLPSEYNHDPVETLKWDLKHHVNYNYEKSQGDYAFNSKVLHKEQGTLNKIMRKYRMSKSHSNYSKNRHNKRTSKHLKKN